MLKGTIGTSSRKWYFSAEASSQSTGIGASKDSSSSASSSDPSLLAGLIGPAVSTTLGWEEKRKHCPSLATLLLSSSLTRRAESWDLVSSSPALCHEIRLDFLVLDSLDLDIFFICGSFFSPSCVAKEVDKLMVENASEGGLVSTDISSLRLDGEEIGEHQAAGTAEVELVQSGRGVMDSTSSMLLVHL